MALQPSETRDLFARELSFPIGQDAVVETVGNVAIASQNGDATEIETVLTRSGETTYASVGELHNTVMANLGDEHVGRTEYDDRSSTIARESELSL